jgi:hypothetical protein
LINSRRITLPRLDRLINQCCTLERSVKRSGRDEITHPTHGRDDLITSAAGVAAVVQRMVVAEEPFIVPPAKHIRMEAPTDSIWRSITRKDDWSVNW